MALNIFFASTHIVCLVLFSEAASKIDQSQTGDLNVHVNLKDIRVIALLKNSKEEYVDYDYAYDYSEMTIKPQNSTTEKPFNITTTDFSNENFTETTTEKIMDMPPLKNTSVVQDNATYISTSPSSTIADTISSTSYITSSSDNMDRMTTTQIPNIPTITNNTIQCKKGFIINKKGECELKLQSSSTNALLKLVKLSQKLKLRREN